jgi:gas vesicle protein
MAPKERKENSVFAFAVGVFLGAGIALLLAPQSGERVRRDIRRMGKKALNKTQALQLELSRSIDNMADDVREKLQAEMNRGREWTENTLAEVRKVLDAGKEYIRGEIDKIKG